MAAGGGEGGGRGKGGGRYSAAFSAVDAASGTRRSTSSMIEIGAGEGMMTMNQSLHRLVRRNIITTTEAFKHTSDPDGLRRLMEKSS